MFVGLCVKKRWRLCVKREKSNQPKIIEQATKAEQVMIAFKDAHNTDRALMLTGPWGIGKTLFYKGSLKEKIKEKYPDRPIIEVSCFSISNCDALILQILNKIYGLEWLIILYNRFTSILSSSTQFKQALIPKNMIIMIDDFEFSSFSDETYKDILGLVQYLIMVKNCHVLLICNEEEMDFKEKEKEKKYYHSFCQKIIRKYEYTPSQETINAIIDNFEANDKDKKYSYSDRIKEQALSKYFEDRSWIVLIASIIKNFHKADEYSAYKEERKDKDSTPADPNKFDFISKLPRLNDKGHYYLMNEYLSTLVFNEGWLADVSVYIDYILSLIMETLNTQNTLDGAKKLIQLSKFLQTDHPLNDSDYFIFTIYFSLETLADYNQEVKNTYSKEIEDTKNILNPTNIEDEIKKYKEDNKIPPQFEPLLEALDYNNTKYQLLLEKLCPPPTRSDLLQTDSVHLS